MVDTIVHLFFWVLVVFGCYAYEEISPKDAIKWYAEDAITNIRLRLHQAAQRHEGKRQKRSIELAFVNRSALPSVELQIDSIVPIQSIPTSHPVNLQPFKIGNTQYLAVVNFQSTSGEYNTMSEIYKMINGKFTLLQRFPTSGCVDFEYAKLLMENLIIFVENVGKNWLGLKSYSQSFKVYDYAKSNANGNEFQYSSSVGMHGGTRVKSFVHGSKNYFVAVNSYSSDGNKHNTKSTLYLKTKYGFLLVQQFETQGAQDAEVFVIDGLVYIAFANYKDNEERVDIYSTIYREKRPLDTKMLISFEYAQRILTHAAKDFEYFYFRNNHYLVVANERSQLITYNTNSKTKNFTVTNDYEVDSVIYWWSGKFFVEWQRIPTNGAVRWSSFSVPTGDGMMLTVANSKAFVVIYTYDAVRGLFKATRVQGLSPFANNLTVPDVRSVQPFTVDNETYLAVANFKPSTGYNIFKVKFVQNAVSDVKPSLVETLTSSLTTIKVKLNELKRRLSKTKSLLHDVMTIEANQTVTGLKRFKRAKIDKLKVANLIYTNNTKNNPIEKAVHQAMLLSNNLTEHGKLISELQDRLLDAVTKNSSQNVTGVKTFTAAVKFSNLSVSYLKVGLVDGINVTDLERRAWHKSKNQNISGQFHFVQDVTLLKDLIGSGLVNGLRIPDNVMTTNTNQKLTGKKLFTENITIFGNITTTNFTINGMNIPNDLVLKSSQQRIFNSKIFKSGVKFRKSVSVNGSVNGKHLGEFSRNIVTLTTNQWISGKKIFLNGFHAKANLDASGFVDGVNLTNLSLDAVRIGVNETIKGKKKISGSMVVGGNLRTLSTTNGYWLQSDLMTTKTNQFIKSKKTFRNIYAHGNIETNSTIDGINLLNDAVTKSDDQVISGSKTFLSNFSLNGHMQVHGTIDGVDITKLNISTAKINKNNVITASKLFTGKVVVDKQLLISNKINNVDLKDLRENVLTTHRNQTITAAISFENVKILPNLNVKGKMNYVRVPQDLLLLNKDTEISENITFVNDIVFTEDVKMSEKSRVNGEVLHLFANSVVLNGTDQNIHGTKTFTKALSIEKDLNVTGTINNVRIPDDFVTLNTKQNVTGTKRFTNGITIHGELSTDIINVSNTVNDIYISDLLRDMIYTDKNQTIKGNVIFTGNLTSKGNIKVGKLIDGINITELSRDIVSLSKPQSISGIKTFSDDVSFVNSLSTPGEINKVNLTELNANSLKKTGDQIISGIKVFNEVVYIQRNLDCRTINSIDLQSFQEKIVKKHGFQEITGSLQFLNNASFGRMILNGSIDGLRVADLMLTFADQTVSGKKVFHSNLSIESDVELKKTINGVNLTELDSSIMKIGKDENVSALLIFNSGLHVNGSINITGLVNNVNIDQLNMTSVHTAENQVISGNKTFLKNVTIRGNVVFEDSLNNVNMTSLLSDAMLKSEEQVLCADKDFTSSSGVRIGSTFIATNMKTLGHVNGVDIVDLESKAVHISKDQVLQGEYIFHNDTRLTDNVVTNGHVNNINVSSDIMMKHGDQTINGYKQFQHLIANRNINVTGKVDGIDISEFAMSRVTLSTKQRIEGMKSFNSLTTIKGNLDLPHNATVNNIDVSEELLLTKYPQMISGEKTFKKTVTIRNHLNISGTVNGLNLRFLNKDIVRLDNLQQLIGTNTFKENLKVYGDIKVVGYVDGLKIERIYNETKVLETTSNNQLNWLNITSKLLCRKIKVMTQVAGAEIYLTAIEKIGTMSRDKLGQIHATNIGSMVYISIARMIGSGCGPAYILRCTPALHCITTQIVRTRALNLHFYEISGKTYVFVGHWGPSTSGCPSYPEILRYDLKTQTFLSYHNITTSLLGTIGKIKGNEAISTNVVALIPTSLLTSALFTSPITSLGSILTQKPAITSTFTNNGTTFLVTASVLIDIYYIEVFVINTTTLAATKLQQITTREVSSIAVGKVNGKTMLACAEGRLGSYRDVKIYTFVPSRKLFFFYQRITVHAVSVRFSTIHTKHYIVFASPEHGFGLCPWRGVMGFEKCLSVPDVGIRYIHTIVTADGVFAVGTTNSQMVSYKAFFEGLVPRYNETLQC